MFRNLILTLIALLALPLGTAQADLKIVATIPDLASLAEEIGGDHVEVTALSLHTQDPHFVDPKPSLILEANKADMLVAVGLSLEIGWLPTLQTGARNAKIQNGGAGFFTCSQVVRLLEVPKGKIDRSMGDVHPGGNPHYLYDPRQAKACAAGMAARMMQLDPKNAGVYSANLTSFVKRLDAKIAQWERRMKEHRGTPVITYHRSWSYLIDWLGLERVANLEPKPGIAPSPGHLVKVIRAGKQRGVKLLFQESYYPSRTAKLVADKIGARGLELEAGTNYRGGQSYIERMEVLVSTLEAALH